MYKQMIRNYSNFRRELGSAHPRVAAVDPYQILFNPAKYKTQLQADPQTVNGAEYLLGQLEELVPHYPFLKKLLWELWAYGFNSKKPPVSEKVPDSEIHEIIKILKLLYSTAYM